MTDGVSSSAPSAVEQLDRLNHLLSRPPWQLRFPPELEAAFARRQMPGRLLAARIGVLIGIPLYLASTWMEWRSDSELFRSAMPVRIVIVTLLLIVGLLLYRIRAARQWVEWLAASVVLIMALIQLHVSHYSGAEYQPLPLLWLLLPLIYLCTMSRVSLRITLPVSLIVSAIFATGIRFGPLWASPAAAHALLMFSSFVVLLLISSYLSERAQRQRFLQAALLSLHRQGLHQCPHVPERTLDDELGILDRNSLDHRLRSQLARAPMVANASLPHDSSPQVALVVCAIDDYDALRSTYSEQEARFCLQTVARTAQRLVTGSSDVVARRGERELALVLDGGNAFDAVQLAERLRRQIEALGIPHFGTANQIITLSCGVADAAGLTESSADALLSNADRALTQAQRQGGNRIEVWRSV